MSEEENQDREGQDEVAEDAGSSEDLLDEWPFSNNFILAAILLLITAAFTLAFRTEEKANQYAIWAYYSLVVGVFLRFVEIVLEERFGVELKPYIYTKLEPLTSRLKTVSAELKQRLKQFSDPYIEKVKDRIGGIRSSSVDVGEDDGTWEEGEYVSGKNLVSKLSSVSRLFKQKLPDLGGYRIVKEYYVCEGCGARFDSTEKLENHRKESH